MAEPVLIHAKNAVDASKQYGVPASVILALMKVEGGTDANGNPVRPGDGLGPPSYGQFIYSTGKSLGVKYGDSRSETFAVARYLDQLGYSDDPTRALARYNGGANPPAISWQYAEKVKTAAKAFLGFDDGTAKAPTSASSGSSASGGADKKSDAWGGTLARVGLTAALVLAGAALVLVGVSRATGLGAKTVDAASKVPVAGQLVKAAS